MNSLTYDTRRFLFKFYLGKKRYAYEFKPKSHQKTGPSLWNETTKKAFLYWIGTMYSSYDEEMKLRLGVKIFYGIPIKTYKKIKESLRLQILPSLENLFAYNTLNKWLIPSVRFFWRKYYGPADKLSNLTAFEFFNACEPLYWKWKQTGDEKALTSLVAVLYRPRRSDTVNNDLRADFTDAGTAKRAKLFRFVNLNTKRAIAFNYEGCRNFIVKIHPKVFQPKGGMVKKRNDVTLSLAGGALGDLNSTRKTNLYDFLLHLERLIEQDEQNQRV